MRVIVCAAAAITIAGLAVVPTERVAPTRRAGQEARLRQLVQERPDSPAPLVDLARFYYDERRRADAVMRGGWTRA